MRGYAPAAAILLALALQGCQTGMNAKTGGDAGLNYKDWATSNKPDNTGRHHYFAGTRTVDPSTGLWNELGVDMAGNGCRASRFIMFISLPAEADKTVLSQNMTGTMRVDDQAPIPLTYQYKLTRGKKVFFLQTSDEMSSEATYGLVTNGQNIRFALTVEGKAYDLRFTLRNNVAAMQNAALDCVDGAEINPDGRKPAPRPVQAPPAPASEAPVSPGPEWNSNDDDKVFFQ